MYYRKSWVEEQIDLEKKGYKFNDMGECIFDPTAPVIPKVEVKQEAPHRVIELEPKKKVKPEKVILKGRRK